MNLIITAIEGDMGNGKTKVRIDTTSYKMITEKLAATDEQLKLNPNARGSDKMPYKGFKVQGQDMFVKEREIDGVKIFTVSKKGEPTHFRMFTSDLDKVTKQLRTESSIKTVQDF